MPFAQLVVGPPGSGKSTYCDGMHQFLSAIGRPASVVNLDPANEHTSYAAALDVRSLVRLEDVMASSGLGPNGGVLLALETVERDFAWLQDGLRELGDDEYVIFDCPGQVELFTHHDSLRNIFLRLQKLGYQLVVMNLVDSYVLTKPSLYISSLLLALRSMLQLDLPAINVLTKIDNLHRYPPLPFNLDFYTEVHDLHYLLPHLDAEEARLPGRSPPSPGDDGNDDAPIPPPSRFAALNEAIVSLVTDFPLVAFEPLVVDDRASISSVLRAADKALGYIPSDPSSGAAAAAGVPPDAVWSDTMWRDAVRAEPGAQWGGLDAGDVQERWIDGREEADERERRAWREEGEAAAGGGGEAEAEAGGGDERRGDGEDLDLARGMMGMDLGVKVVRVKKKDAAGPTP
jgi:hypothetical protein